MQTQAFAVNIFPTESEMNFEKNDSGNIITKKN